MKRRAFSLVEMMVAVLLVVMLAGAVYSFMWSVLDDRARLEKHAGREIGATRLFACIEDDLATCVARTDSGASGIKGDSGSIAIAKRSVRLDATGAEALGDATQSEYRFEESAGQVLARRDGGGYEPILTGVSRVRFRFRQGSEWVEQFDSVAAGGVPSAVEIALWFGEPEVVDEPAPVAPVTGDGEDDAKPESPVERDAADELLPPPSRVTVIAIHDAGEIEKQEVAP